MRGIRRIVLTLFLASALTMTFVAVSGQTTSSASTVPFPQAGKFYTLVGRGILWNIIDGEKIITHGELMIKWSIQGVVSDVALANCTLIEVYISPETDREVRADVSDIDSEIAIDRTILSRYMKGMSFGSITGWGGSSERPIDEDVGEHTWAWFPTDLSTGAEVQVSWTTDRNFLGDVLHKVVGEEVIQVVGERQECWKLYMSPKITDGELAGERVHTETFWVDKDTGVPLKLCDKGWLTDGSGGWEEEFVLVNTNIDLGPESTKAPSPTYTLTVPTSPGYPEAGKFLTWYYIADHYNNETGVTSYEEGLLLRWIVSATDDKALLYRIDLVESICEAEGVEELEAVTLNCINYTIGTTSRGYLNATGLQYHINMTSLDWWKKEFHTEWRIGRETSYWVPTNLYIGANVNFEYGTWTVMDEKIVNTLGEWQAIWVVHLPPTFEELWNLNITDTTYIDKDAGIILKFFTKSWSNEETWLETGWLVDTNIDLGPEVTLSIKLSGELDYLENELVKIRLAALVRDTNTMEPVSGADVTIDIYLPTGKLWKSGKMVERLPGTGIYEWLSSGTIRGLGLKKGVYLVHAQASFPGDPTATDILEFHVDPPPDSSALITLITTVLLGFAGLILLTKFIHNRLRHTSQKDNIHTQ